MRTLLKPKRTPDAAFTRTRVRGLQSIMCSGSEDHAVLQMTLNKLNQLRWEKERLKRERSNWEERIRVIDETLQEVSRSENVLKEKLAESCREAVSPMKPQSRNTRRSEPKENESVVIRY